MIRLLTVVGPTAAGKSAVALGLAEKLSGEVVSADSMQVYRGMDIGTAKPSAQERLRVPHHLIDVADPSDNFSVADYQRLARAAIADISARNKLPLLVGGSGLYVRAVIDRFNFPKGTVDSALRRRLEERVAKEGGAALHAELKKADPTAAAKIDPRNSRRVIRALEVNILTGKRFSSYQTEWTKRESDYDLAMIGLSQSPEKLCAKIEKRVEEQLELGLLDEVRALKDRGFGSSLTSGQALGYKELLQHLEGTCSLEAALSIVKTKTMRLAKAQRTWFRQDHRIYWIDTNQKDRGEVEREILDYLREGFLNGADETSF